MAGGGGSSGNFTTEVKPGGAPSGIGGSIERMPTMTAPIGGLGFGSPVEAQTLPVSQAPQAPAQQAPVGAPPPVQQAPQQYISPMQQQMSYQAQMQNPYAQQMYRQPMMQQPMYQPQYGGLQALLANMMSRYQQPSMGYQQQYQAPMYQSRFASQNNPLAYRPDMSQAQAALSRVKPSVYKTDLDTARARIAELEGQLTPRGGD